MRLTGASSSSTVVTSWLSSELAAFTSTSQVPLLVSNWSAGVGWKEAEQGGESERVREPTARQETREWLPSRPDKTHSQMSLFFPPHAGNKRRMSLAAPTWLKAPRRDSAAANNASSRRCVVVGQPDSDKVPSSGRRGNRGKATSCPVDARLRTDQRQSMRVCSL
ncbi:unnamed protein product [Protopolystoma xenopodis]|uniref:Uncharacterized protein n=1 Tax=Protopolystoma xenopodis TaxID=117903 RepID=A0A448XJI0_9PLAT|nr:unnamed protein product [Protopolystoma xenopodis]